MRLFFKAFDSKMASREKLFKAAVEFANQIGRERLMTLSHSEDRDNIVITIWYWAEEEIKPQDLKRIAAQASRTTPVPGATPRPGGSDLPIGLSGGFAAIPKTLAQEQRDLGQTPTTPPSIDDSLP